MIVAAEEEDGDEVEDDDVGESLPLSAVGVVSVVAACESLTAQRKNDTQADMNRGKIHHSIAMTERQYNRATSVHATISIEELRAIQTAFAA